MEPRYPWYYVSTLTAFVYWIVYRTMERICPADLKEQKKSYWWSWIVINCIFSAADSIGALYSLYQAPEMLNDMLYVWTPAAYYVVSMAVGFFAWDTVTTYLTGDMWLFHLCFYHHAIIVTSFVFRFLLPRQYIALGVVLQLMQVHSFFLHMQRILRSLKTDESNWIFRINSILALVACAIFRVLLSFWFVSCIVANRKRAPYEAFGALFSSIFFLHQNIKIFGKAWKTAMWHERYKKTV